MSRTVVTGSSGFIGSHLIKKLNGSLALQEHSDIVYGHTYNSEKLFFFSTYGNMAHHTDHQMMVKANVRDLLAMLKGFDGWLCYMSSSSVNLPVQTPYSRTKRAGEEILQALPELQSCIVRPYSVTGVREQQEHLIPTLIRSCFEGALMDFVPSATHDYIDVEDLTSAMIRLADDKATGIHEFGNGFALENDEVRLLVEDITGMKANIRTVKPLRVYDNENWCCQNKSKYWEPTKPLRQSITEMVEAYRNEHS